MKSQDPRPKTQDPKPPQPLGDHILVEMMPEDTKAGSFIIPEEHRKKPQEGIVRAIGTSRYTAKGVPIPFDVQVGDRVLLARFDVTKIVTKDGEWMMPDSAHILARLD